MLAPPRRGESLPMSLPYRVTLQGFSAFERSALASYFRLAANRSPAYEQVETMADAQFLIVDADHVEAVRSVQTAGRVRDGVFIGAQAPDGASAWMMRPIDPLHVLRELDAMVGALDAASARQRPPTTIRPLLASDPGGAYMGPSGRTAGRHLRTGSTPSRRATDVAPAPTPTPPSPRSPPSPLPPPPPTAAPRPAPPPKPDAARPVAEALLVDDSDIALRFLEVRLQRLGVHTERASTSGKAIELLSRKAYRFIFLDVDLGPASDLDGLSLCQHIKRQHHHVGGLAVPVVAMVSAFQSELDRARGALAGADAYLGKPLDEVALARLLAVNGVAPVRS